HGEIRPVGGGRSRESSAVRQPLGQEPIELGPALRGPVPTEIDVPTVQGNDRLARGFVMPVRRGSEGSRGHCQSSQSGSLPAFLGMVQKRRFSGNTRNLSADPDRSRVGAGFRESLAAMLGLQFRENRVYPRSSSQ